jgi:uroporphyrinogen decarboxylase
VQKIKVNKPVIIFSEGMATKMLSKSFRELNAERIAQAEKLKKPDCVPVSLSLHHPFLASFAGVKIIEYFNDPRVMAEAQLRARRAFFGLKNLYPDYVIVAEASALGCKIKWQEDDSPLVFPVVEEPEDVHKLEVPDCYHSAYMAVSIAAYRYMEALVGEENVDFWYCLGPFDLACLVRGQSRFFADIKLRPELAHEILEITTRTIIEWTKVREEIVGERFERVGLGDDFPGYLGPKLFKEFALPYIKRVFEAFPNRIHYWHSDGDTTSVLELIPEMHVEVFNNFYPDADISEFKRRIGNRVCLIGNIHPLKVMLRGTPEQVEKECKRQIEIAAIDGGYVLSTGGEMPRGVPEENILTMIRSVEKYGRLEV